MGSRKYPRSQTLISSGTYRADGQASNTLKPAAVSGCPAQHRSRLSFEAAQTSQCPRGISFLKLFSCPSPVAKHCHIKVSSVV